MSIQRNQFIKDVMTGKIKEEDWEESYLSSIQYDDEEFIKISNEQINYLNATSDIDDYGEIIDKFGKEYLERMELIRKLINRITIYHLRKLREKQKNY